MDLSRLSTADLEALQANDLSRVSTAGLRILQELQAGPAPKARFSGADTMRAVGQGALGGIKALTDVFGAGNAASNILEAGTTRLQEGMSPGRKAEMERQAQRMREAEASGDVKREAMAGLENFMEAPVQATAQGLGSIVPFAATSVAGAAAKLLPVTIRAIQTAMGAGMGAGAVKGSIYDAVYKQNIDDGKAPAVAHQQAQAAQEYVGKNAEQIALGTGLGAVAARTGAEKLLVPGAEKGLAAGMARRVGKAVAEEVPLEAAQGGQERMAANIALQREGVDVPTFQGVAGQAVQEGLTAGMAAAPIAAYRSPRAGMEAAARAEEAKRIETAAAEQQAALEAKRADPQYLTALLAKQNDFSAKITALNEAVKSGEKNDPLAQAKRDQAKAARAELMQSDDYLAYKEAYAEAKPQVDALRIEQDKAKSDAEAAAQAQAEADRQDPVKQQALHTQQAALVRQKTDLLAQSSQLARSGDTEQALALRAQVTELDKQIAAMAPLMGKLPEPPRTYTSTPTQTEEAQIRARLAQLVGGTNARGKEMTGAYAQAKTDEDAAAILAESAPLQARLREIESLRARTGQQADILAEQENVPNEPGQSWSSAPLPGINTDALAEGVFGKTENMIPGTPQTTGDKTRLPTPPTNVVTRTLPNGLRVTRREAGAAPDTTQLEQESMFPDMEQGGNAGTPLENLRTQIDQLKTRPNMPAATLAQLDNYRRVLDNPALENADNERAQNALADIADNLNRIAYRGEGQGVARNASVNEVRAKVAAVDTRLGALTASIEQAKADARSAAPETQFDRSTELRNLLRTQQELLAERDRLQNTIRVNLTPYERQQKQLVTIGSETPTEATPEQISRAQKGDKRGYEVGAVPVEPGTQRDITFQQEAGEDGETTTTARYGEERVADRAPSLDRGMARTVRTGERVVSQERAGPDDASIVEAEAQMSEADTQTIDLWDEVFGPNSPARQMVDAAQDGLRYAQQAVANTTRKLEEAQTLLRYHQTVLQKAVQMDPEVQKRMLLQGSALEVQRKLERAQENVQTAEQVKDIEGATVDAQVRATQAAVAEAEAAVRKASNDTDAALKAFRTEWKNAEKSGWVTPELLNFLQGRSVKDDLAKARADLADVVSRTNSQGVRDAAGLAEVIRVTANVYKPTDTLAAIQEAHVALMPQIRKAAGPRVASLIDTIFKLRIADAVVGKAQAYAEEYATKQVGLNRVRQRMEDKVRDAKAAIAASETQMSKASVRVEIARAEAAAVEKQLTEMRAEIDRLLQTEPGGEAVQAAQKNVSEAEKTVAQTTARLGQLTASQDSRITEARANLQRAKKTQQDLFENEQALRDGRPLPLQVRIDDLNASTRAVFDSMEASIADEAVMPTIDLTDVDADLQLVEKHMADLQRVEDALTKLLQQHISDFTQVQEDVETLLDTSTLLASDVFDPERENAQRVVNRAGTLAQLRSMRAEEARTMSQRDTALGSIDRALEENAFVVAEKNPSAEHLALLQRQRTRLIAKRTETEKLYTDRLTTLRDKAATLEPELATAPDPKLKDWGKTQIETLRGLRNNLQEQINRIHSRIKAVQVNRAETMKQQYAMGKERVAALERLGLGRSPSVTEAKRTSVFNDLVASLTQQRVEERRADKKVEAAYQRMRDLRSRLFEAPLAQRANLRSAAVEAHKAWRAAALDRARLQDDLIGLERMQLSLAQELASIPTQQQVTAAPRTMAVLRKETEDLERAQRMYDNAYDVYDILRANPNSTPAKIEAAAEELRNAKARLVKADKRKLGYTNTEGRAITPETDTVQATAANPAAVASMAEQLQAGVIAGPAVETETPELVAFRERVDNSHDLRALAKERGGLRAAYEGVLNEYQTKDTRNTLTKSNAALLKSNSPFARAAVAGMSKNMYKNEALDLFDRLRILDDRIEVLKGGRKPSLQRIADTQGAPGRRGVAMRPTVLVGEFNVGIAENNKAIATGNRSKVTEGRIVTSPTAQQVVAKANEDTAKGSILRRQMEQAKLERELEQARQERAAAKEKHDAVMAAPKASAAAKDNVTAALAAAVEKVKAADAALVAELQSKPLTSREGGGKEAASQFRSDRQTTEVDDDVVRAVQDGRVLDAAKLLAARGSTPEVRERAAKLIPMLMRTKISVEPVVMVDGKSVAGKYDPSNNAITMAPGGINEEDLMHEMTHAATDRTLLAPDSTLTDDQRAAKRELEALRASLVASPKFANEDIENTREFAAEVYSNEALRAKMDSIGKPLTLWQRFKNLVSRLLGWGTPDKPLSKKAEELVDRILQPSRKIDTTAPAAPSAWRAPKADTTSALGKMADSITAKPTNPLTRLGHNPALMLEAAVADMRAPLIKALSLAGEKTLNQATYYVRKADALMNHVYASLSKGPLELVKTSKGNFEIRAGNGPSMRVLLDAVRDIKGVSPEDKMAKLQAYLAGQRAERVGWEKLDFTNAADLQKQASAVKAELAADPAQKAALENARRVYNEMNKGTVGFLAASGYISKAKAAELLQYGDYVPFYRVRENGIAELVMGESAVIRVGDIRTNKFLAPLVGDDNKLLPLNEAIVRNTMLLTDMAMKNLAAKDVAYALQKIGSASRVKGRNAMRIHSGKAPAGDDVVTFRQEPDPAEEDDTGERWMRVRTHGTALEHIPADMLVQSLEGSFSTLPAGLKAAAWFGDLLRSGVTRNPMYIVRQLIRDPLAATFTGGLESGIVKSVFKTLGNYAEQTAGRSKEGEVLMRKGLTQSGIFTGDIDDINKMMLQITKGDESALKKTLAWWDKAAMSADAATRIQMYKDAKARGLDEMEAELAAMEMMNFNKRGSSPTVQYAARMIPFLNAQIQGLNVLAKAMTGNMPQNEKLAIKEKFYRRAVTMALFTIGYAMAMEDDETYKTANPRDRYSNWFLPNPTGGEAIKLPIPFEVGLLFKALPEALVDVMRGDFNDEEFTAIRKAFTAQIPGAGAYYLPQAVKPVIEVVTNHNFFTEREIESVSDRGKDSVERFGSGTTELAKEMSKIINATGIELSPKQIDHLISGYLGSVPIMIARLTNNVFASTESATRPTERLSDSPIFGSMFQRTLGGGPVNAAYAHEEALSQAKRTYDGMVSSGRKADAEAYKESVLNMLGSPEMAKRFKSQIDLLQKADKAARNTIKDPDALRTRLDELEKKKHEVSKLYLNAVRQIAQ